MQPDEAFMICCMFLERAFARSVKKCHLLQEMFGIYIELVPSALCFV